MASAESERLLRIADTHFEMLALLGTQAFASGTVWR
jgi:hypothetical protein